MILVTVAYVITASLGALFAAFELRCLWYFFRQRRAIRRLQDPAPTAVLDDAAAPTVTIQIPLYNERTAAALAIRAAALQDYPRERFDIQVLDDSTDETCQIVADLVAELARDGLRISHVRRDGRVGFKAGALKFGLERSQSELVAVLDADFVPPPNFLRRLILEMDAFGEERVAFVQARWAFANSDENLLTAAQALLIDRHFFVQKPTWAVLGRVTQFNGSGGIWRRRAIDDAGGWSADTLTEDLDLSYRAAMRGWHGLYIPAVVADSELPSHLLSFKLQQRRWARGSAQSVRKLAPNVIRSSVLRNRGDELFLLGGYIIHPILLLNTLLWPWAVQYMEPKGAFLIAQIFLSVAMTVGPAGFVVTAREQGRPLSLRFARDVLFATMIGMGLMVNNTIAHCAGYWSKRATFERTPKRAQSSRVAGYRLPLDWTLGAELFLLLYSMGSAVWLAHVGQWLWVPPCVIWTATLGVMLALQMAPQPARVTVAQSLP